MAVSSNAALASMGLPVLTTVTGALSVTGNAVLRQCLVDVSPPNHDGPD